MAHVVNKTQNFELPLSWITLIQEGFQITLTKSGMDLLLPPYHATIVPGSSTSKHGSGAEIGASSQSCSLVDDGSGIVLLESEVLRVSRLSDNRVPKPCSVMELQSTCAHDSDIGSSPCSGGFLPLPLYDAYICSILEGFVPLYHHEALSSCFWSFDAAAVKASNFVLLFVAVSLSQLSISLDLPLVGCVSYLLKLDGITIHVLNLLHLVGSSCLSSLLLQVAGVVFLASPLSNVDGFGLASWFYLVAAFADLDVLLHLSGVALFWFARVVGVVACFAAMHPVAFVLDFGYPAIVALLFVLAASWLDINWIYCLLLKVQVATEEPVLLHCAALSTLRSGCGMILAAGLLGLLELRIAPATPTANPICKRESVPLI
ncbi:hypothetical protein NC653_028477 [Populus alba x Populus x berolinensis]|uniref:Uncharacterized protein n=1 Tax=Populus alba x Populus x berolinensis TaxID=444605 RepID=A0AAD6M0Z0_9ROSI|nr:hypothetical protein NC653_028477 [Populus alba x Populus x berolinensis]